MIKVNKTYNINYKVNPRTVYVYQNTGASIGKTQVKLDKSLITGKVAA